MRTAIAALAIIVLFVARHLLATALVELFKAGLRIADRLLTYVSKSIWNLLRANRKIAGPLPHDDNTPLEPR